MRLGNKDIDSSQGRCYYTVKLSNILSRIEVARFKSIPLDVADTEEEGRKENAPKGSANCKSSLGHRVKSSMTVI